MDAKSAPGRTVLFSYIGYNARLVTGINEHRLYPTNPQLLECNRMSTHMTLKVEHARRDHRNASASDLKALNL